MRLLHIALALATAAAGAAAPTTITLSAGANGPSATIDGHAGLTLLSAAEQRKGAVGGGGRAINA